MQNNKKNINNKIDVSIMLNFRSVYPLNAAPQYHYTTPLFDTWTGIPNNDLGDWDKRPGINSVSIRKTVFG